jgi:hypothetical protein
VDAPGGKEEWWISSVEARRGLGQGISTCENGLSEHRSEADDPASLWGGTKGTDRTDRRVM